MSTPPLTAEVVPLGAMHRVACSVVAAHLETIIGLRAVVTPPRPVPDAAFLAPRGQYDAAILLRELARGLDGPLVRIGVTVLDICLPILTHVYGEAMVGRNCAVVSIHRLARSERGAPVPQSLALARLAKVALHEAAHAIGLTHCHHPRCVQCSSHHLERLDGLELAFCPACQRTLRGRLLRSSGTR